MKISHPLQHIDLEPLNRCYEALDQFLQDGLGKLTVEINYHERDKIVNAKDMLQDVIIKLRIQNTDSIKYLAEGNNGRLENSF